MLDSDICALTLIPSLFNSRHTPDRLIRWLHQGLSLPPLTLSQRSEGLDLPQERAWQTTAGNMGDQLVEHAEMKLTTMAFKSSTAFPRRSEESLIILSASSIIRV
jgi:hypothetical protein